MSYSLYKRSAERQSQQFNLADEDNPFLTSTPSSANIPSIFKDCLPDCQFETSDRPFKRTKVENDFTPSRNTTNFIPELKGLQDSIFSQGSFNTTSPKLVNDLTESRLKITALEHTKNDFERKVARLETNKQNMELQIKELNLSIEKSKSDCKFFYDRELETSKKLERLESEYSLNKQNYARESSKLRNEISKLTQQLQNVQNDRKTKESEYYRTIEALNSEKQILDHKLENQNEQIQRQSEISASRQALLNQAQAQLAETQQKLQEEFNISSQLGDIPNLKKFNQEQSERIRNLEKNNLELTSELKRLRDLSPSIQILDEKVKSYEHQLSNLNSLRRQAAELEAENIMLKREKIEWTSYLDKEKDIINVNSAYNLCKELASRRIEIEMLQERGRNLEEQIKSKDIVISECESKIMQLNNRCKATEYKFFNELEASKKTKNLLQMEVEMLTRTLKSYDDEEKHLKIGNYDSQKSEHIQVLEKMLSEYKKELEVTLETVKVEKTESYNSAETGFHSAQILQRNEELQSINFTLENENANLKKEIFSLKNQISVLEQDELKIHSAELIKQNELLQETIKELKNENASLKKEVSSLDQQVVSLQQAVGRGEYNRECTKLLEMKENPSTTEYAIRRSALQALKTENQQLLERLKSHLKHDKELEEDYDENNVIPIQSFFNLEGENNQLIEQIAKKEIRITRLLEAWKAKAQEFREAIYSLLGYKLEFLENGRVRLTSMYSEQDDHSFVFTSDDDDCGTMQLIGGGNTEYIKSLDSLIKYWVVERNSIPCFLSSLTIKLFESTTFGPVGRDLDMSINSTLNLMTNDNLVPE
ncbi:hypothetical protein Glove_437g42 [Diversispora epigaea]|uniref:Spindle assembly checkpoint component MAD1 n=1 Tax=Diversispora epigaea TaxID=1348612 RepID=A0A397GVV9_9GLOM|nr:hypothetical protein Glove_437g42 [Diversispora epigaea]